MYVCGYVCMHACMHACMYACIQNTYISEMHIVCVYIIYIYMYANTQMCISACFRYMYRFTCILICIICRCLRICMAICTAVNTFTNKRPGKTYIYNIYAYSHTDVCIYICICMHACVD